MKIKYLGHSTFKITSDKTIVIDPHDPEYGTLPADLTADIVTVSHSHHDHNYLAGVRGEPKIIDSVGEYDLDNIKITGVPTFHDDSLGVKRGGNIVFVYEIEGLRLSHLGDLGHLLNDDQLNQIGPIDIVMISVGGTYTIDADQAVEVVKQLQAKVVLPMHYKTADSASDSVLAPVDDFVQKMGWKVEKVVQFEINTNNLDRFAGKVIIFSS